MQSAPTVGIAFLAKEIKRDSRIGLFAATPPLEAKKILFSLALTEGYGYDRGNRDDGMKSDFIDIRKAYFNAPPDEQCTWTCQLRFRSLERAD